MLHGRSDWQGAASASPPETETHRWRRSGPLHGHHAATRFVHGNTKKSRFPIRPPGRFLDVALGEPEALTDQPVAGYGIQASIIASMTSCPLHYLQTGETRRGYLHQGVQRSIPSLEHMM